MYIETQIAALKMQVAKLQEQVELLVRAGRPCLPGLIAAESRSRSGGIIHFPNLGKPTPAEVQAAITPDENETAGQRAAAEGRAKRKDGDA